MSHYYPHQVYHEKTTSRPPAALLDFHAWPVAELISTFRRSGDQTEPFFLT